MNSNITKCIYGYVTVRKFSGMAIPVPVQNMLLRKYSTDLAYTYALPKNEHKYEDCYMQLFDTIKTTPNGADIAMCSAFMLPQKPAAFNEVCRCIMKKNITIHCLFEAKVLNQKSDFVELYELMRLRAFTERSKDDVSALLSFIQQKPSNPNS